MCDRELGGQDLNLIDACLIRTPSGLNPGASPRILVVSAMPQVFIDFSFQPGVHPKILSSACSHHAAAHAGYTIRLTVNRHSRGRVDLGAARLHPAVMPTLHP